MGSEKNEIGEPLKIEPYTLVHDILVNWWVILLGAISAALLTFVIMNVRYVPQYTTKATFVVSSKGDYDAWSSLNSTHEMAVTFGKVLQSNVMEKVISEKLGVSVKEAQISTEVIEGTNMLMLTVTEDSPKKAIDLIRAIMDNYSEVSFYTVGNALMDVLEEPKVPTTPDNPLNLRRDVRNAMLAGALFLMFVFGMISYMTDTIKQEDDIENKLDARDLGSIPFEKKNKTLREMFQRKKSALLVNNPLAGFAFVEGYKKFATKVDYQMRKDNRQVLVVTSVSENEGKSTVAANLALSLAEQSYKVLLIDGDLRRPSQFLIWNLKPRDEEEFGEFLTGEHTIKNIMRRTHIPNLFLMAGRNCYSSSTEIIGSDRMKKLIEACKKRVDYIIIDAPPAGLMGDAEALATFSDAVLFVVKQNYILSEDINDILDAFRDHHSEVLGVVLNAARSFSSSMPIVGKYGKYGKYGNYGNYVKNRGNE